MADKPDITGRRVSLDSPAFGAFGGMPPIYSSRLKSLAQMIDQLTYTEMNQLTALINAEAQPEQAIDFPAALLVAAVEIQKKPEPRT